MAQMRNLSLKFETLLFLYVMSFNFFPLKKLDHVKFGGKRLDNLHTAIR